MRATGASSQLARHILVVANANAHAGIDARQLRAMYGWQKHGRYAIENWIGRGRLFPISVSVLFSNPTKTKHTPIWITLLIHRHPVPCRSQTQPSSPSLLLLQLFPEFEAGRGQAFQTPNLRPEAAAPRNVREVPIEWLDDPPPHGPRIEDVTASRDPRLRDIASAPGNSCVVEMPSEPARNGTHEISDSNYTYNPNAPTVTDVSNHQKS